MWKHWLLGLLVAVAWGPSIGAAARRSSNRQKRFFSLFNIVNFKNNQCDTVTDSDIKGTCFTSSECTDKGGTADGNCAAGFGVCCLIVLSEDGATVSENCTYLQNEDYPSMDTTADETITYEVSRSFDDVCQIRLDFESTTTLTVRTDNGDCQDATSDELTVTSDFIDDSFSLAPPLCGTLSGQHMYFEAGDTGEAATIMLEKRSSTDGRTWNIKVTYIECTNDLLPPAGCTQYYTGLSGNIQAYNYGRMLADQLYSMCIRREEGFCQFQIAESGVAPPHPFWITRTPTGGPVPVEAGRTICPGQFSALIFPIEDTPANTAGHDEFCGKLLNVEEAATVPGVLTSRRGSFMFSFRNDDTSQPNLPGFNLDYTQLPC